MSAGENDNHRHPRPPRWAPRYLISRRAMRAWKAYVARENEKAILRTAQPDPGEGEVGEGDLDTPQADQGGQERAGRGKRPRWQTRETSNDNEQEEE